MESLKINDRKPHPEELVITEKPKEKEAEVEQKNSVTEEPQPQVEEIKKEKTFGQSLFDKVKRFFEDTED